MKNQRGFSTIELVFALFFISLIAVAVFAVGSCSHWLASGEFATDFGETLGEIQNGIDNVRKK